MYLIEKLFARNTKAQSSFDEEIKISSSLKSMSLLILNFKTTLLHLDLKFILNCQSIRISIVIRKILAIERELKEEEIKYARLLKNYKKGTKVTRVK